VVLPVYPRWRGEHAGVTLSASDYVRFIPAGAGNTSTSDISGQSRPVYPRWRGEHITHYSDNERYFGLSPLARGTLVLMSYQYMNWRFIPAGAGNTSLGCISSFQIAVYPRWRGEHAEIALFWLFSAGLSPLARGTRKTTQTANQLSAVYPRWRGEHVSFSSLITQ